jgi:anti-sigma factor RsiW
MAALDAEDRAAAAIAAVRNQRWHILGWGSMVAAAAVILLVVSIPTRSTDPIQNAVAPLVDQASIGLRSTGALESSDPAQLGSWLESQMGYHIDVPAISNAVLIGGRVVDLNHLPAAAVIYTMHGKQLTYFAMPTANLLGTTISNDRVRAVSSGGFNVATWTEAGAARAVVAAMDEKEVVAVARECRQKAAGY